MDGNIKFNSLFRRLDPPKGGLQGLREKLDRPERKKHHFFLRKIALATAFAAIVLAVVFFTPSLMRPGRNSFFELANKTGNPVFMRYGYLKRNSEGVSIPPDSRSHLATMRVKTFNKDIQFYLIENIN